MSISKDAIANLLLTGLFLVRFVVLAAAAAVVDDGAFVCMFERKREFTFKIFSTYFPGRNDNDLNAPLLFSRRIVMASLNVCDSITLILYEATHKATTTRNICFANSQNNAKMIKSLNSINPCNNAQHSAKQKQNMLKITENRSKYNNMYITRGAILASPIIC